MITIKDLEKSIENLTEREKSEVVNHTHSSGRIDHGLCIFCKSEESEKEKCEERTQKCRKKIKEQRKRIAALYHSVQNIPAKNRRVIFGFIEFTAIGFKKWE